MSNRLIGAVRGIALLTIVGLIAAVSAGVITTDAQPAFRVRAAPNAQRFGPETFYGNVVAGSVTTIAGATQFTVDRPKKVGLDVDPTQRETVSCRLENVPPDQVALVAPGQQLYFYGAWDPTLNVFFVNLVGITPEAVAVAGPAGGADNSSSSADNGSSNTDNGDDDADNGSDDADNGSSDNGTSDNGSSDNGDDVDNGADNDSDSDNDENSDNASDSDNDEDTDNGDDSDNDSDSDNDENSDDDNSDDDADNGDDDDENDEDNDE